MDTEKTSPMERELLKRLETSGGNDRWALIELALLYDEAGKYAEALNCISAVIPLTPDKEEQAGLLMRGGQVLEKLGIFAEAEMSYRLARELDPQHPVTRYFVHNNLGYCLNQLGRFAEAKEFLLEAIRIDPHRANGYKNLGICYEGLGLLVNAAEMFVLATKANAADPRALGHLEELVARHGKLLSTVPDLRADLDGCRQAVQKVRELQPRYH